MQEDKGRIDLLDSFRALAILAVLFYHFFSRWNNLQFSYLPYDVFKYGFKGVSFFFIISGFVISYTLENTDGFIRFWKKRIIRLLPSLIVASTITYLFVLVVDKDNFFPDSHYFGNYLISFTFLPPNVFDLVFNLPNHFGYLNYSYWSLWPEIQFYLFVSLLFFWGRKRFHLLFFTISILVIFLAEIIFFFKLDDIKVIQQVLNLFNLIKYLKFFVSGVVFYQLYSNKTDAAVQKKYALILTALYLSFLSSFDVAEFIAVTAMYLMFLLFLYKPSSLSFLNVKWMSKIGVSSYFLYLIHEYIGVLILNKSAHYFKTYSFIAPILVIFFFIGISIFYSINIEKRIASGLKKYLLKG
ncbi:acyltransferase [Flavobacterium sp. SM15]|uniref:acyltransferase family protein n=1 Tax=Flavobacterium sp. SM15 TaxID=2908005 RepID=UPI001EDC2B4E|nr:acyltransferase [Flavobacterium sp. SM15]MCG2611256.1 acyltransferase [Flavobacterium sp. SM15]